jgi:hypothetical protein
MAQLPVLQPGGIMSRGIMLSGEVSNWWFSSLFSNLEGSQVEESYQALDVQLMPQLPVLQPGGIMSREIMSRVRCLADGSAPCSPTWSIEGSWVEELCHSWGAQLMAQLPVLQPGGITSRGITSSSEVSNWQLIWGIKSSCEVSNWCLSSLFSEGSQVEESCQAVRCLKWWLSPCSPTWRNHE